MLYSWLAITSWKWNGVFFCSFVFFCSVRSAHACSLNDSFFSFFMRVFSCWWMIQIFFGSWIKILPLRTTTMAYVAANPQPPGPLLKSTSICNVHYYSWPQFHLLKDRLHLLVIFLRLFSRGNLWILAHAHWKRAKIYLCFRRTWYTSTFADIYNWLHGWGGRWRWRWRGSCCRCC